MTVGRQSISTIKGNVMQKLFVVFAVLLTLGGCASGPTNPLDRATNLREKNAGEAAALVYGISMANVTLDETDKLRHWKLYWRTINTDYSWIEKGTDERLRYIERYCASRNGTIDGPKVTAQVTDKSANEIVCSNAKTGQPIFRVVGSYNHISPSVSRSRVRGGCVSLSSGEPGFDVHKPLACSEAVDVFEWKTPGALADVDRDYKLGSVGFDTVQVVDAELKKQQEESARLTLAAKQQRERQLQLKQQEEQRQREEEQRQREQAIRDLPKIRTVGQKICRIEEITTRKIIGTAMGNPMYGAQIKQQATITGFTENTSGSKIQLRISGMQVNGENLDRIDGDVVYQNGGVVWDEASNWRLCY
jgi:hypothetical protein